MARARRGLFNRSVSGRYELVKLATWNVNSIRARLPNVLAWLREAAPDILLLQEIKSTGDTFP
ncbi:MAG: endonuclease/exonuclease/phosphatase family protein, partial [Alphaproteobacteria bacterium]